MARYAREEPRILIVEEDEYHGLLMEREISRRLETSSVVLTSSADEALRFARLQPFDVSVVDFAPSESGGLGFLKSLHRLNPEVAIIVVTDKITEAMTREVLRNGCREILVKDSSYYLIIPRMVAGLVCRDRTYRPTAGSCRHNRCSASHFADGLSIEVGSAVDVIINTVSLIADRAGEDRALADMISDIQQSALQIKSSLNALRNGSQSGYGPIGSGEVGTSGSGRARAKTSV